MPLRLKTDTLGSNCDLAVCSYRLLRFGETLNLRDRSFLWYSIWVKQCWAHCIGHDGVYESATARWELRRLLPPFSTKVTPEQCPLLICERLQWPTLPAPVLPLQSSKSQHICLPRTYIYCLEWLHAETTSVWHHDPSLVWFNRHSLCSYFFSSSSAQADHWFLEYLQHGCPQETF